MARQANPTKIPVELPALSEDIIQNQNQFIENNTVIIEQFGDGLPYERARVVNEARFFASQSAEAMLQFGKRLILIKENEPHGDFLNIITNEFDITPKTAQRMMQAALKYLSPKLSSNTTALSHLGSTKLFELMVEDDEEIKALATGGTVANLTLDDVEKMTTRELKAALKKSKQDAKEQQAKITEDFDAVLKRNADLSREKEEIALKLTQFEMKTIPLDERLEPFKKQIAETQSRIDELLEQQRQYVQLVDKLQKEIMESDPDYDPEQPYSLPQSLVVTLITLYQSLKLTSLQSKRTYNEMWMNFSDDIAPELGNVVISE